MFRKMFRKMCAKSSESMTTEKIEYLIEFFQIKGFRNPILCSIAKFFSPQMCIQWVNNLRALNYLGTEYLHNHQANSARKFAIFNALIWFKCVQWFDANLWRRFTEDSRRHFSDHLKHYYSSWIIAKQTKRNGHCQIFHFKWTAEHNHCEWNVHSFSCWTNAYTMAVCLSEPTVLKN